MKKLVLVASTLLLAGCNGLIGALGVGGTTVTGTAYAPTSQQASIGFSDAALRVAGVHSGESVLKGADVSATSLAGIPILTATGKTDSSGKFSIAGLPRDSFSVIRVKWTKGEVTALIKPSADSGVKDVNLSSTLVAEGLRSLGDGLNKSAQTAIDSLENLVTASLTTGDLSMALPGDARARFDSLKGSESDIKSQYDALAAASKNASIGFSDASVK